MAEFDMDGHLIVKGKQYNIGDLIDLLINIEGQELVNYLVNIGFNIPRKLRMGVLKDVLRSSVDKTIEERKSLADEMGYRLTWFSKYTDSQLVNLLEWYKNPSLNKQYLESFWATLLAYMVEKGVAETELIKLFTKAKEANKKDFKSNKAFNQALEEVMFDEKDEIDGVTQAQFRPVTYKASTLTELRAIGDKFDAPIPKRLRKQEVLDIIMVKLRERGNLTPELENKLSSQNILLLERYAKDNDIKVSTELKKEEIIEYILSNAKETREIYYAPSSSAVYEVPYEEVDTYDEVEITKASKVEEKQEELIEELIKEEVEEVVVEEPYEEVVEEPVKVVKQRRVMTSVEDNGSDFARIAHAFERIADAIDRKEFNINIGSMQQPVAENKVVGQKPVVQTSQATLDKNDIIKYLLLDDEDDKTTMVVGNQASEVQHHTKVSNEQTQSDKNKVAQSQTVVENISYAKVSRGVQFLLPNALKGVLATLLFISAVLWNVLCVLFIPIEGISQQAVIQENISFFDLSSINSWIYVGVFGLLTIIAIVFGVVILSVKIKRFTLFLLGLLSLVVGFGITGLIAILASLFLKKKEVFEDVPTDSTERILHALKKVENNIQKQDVVKKGGLGGKIILLFIMFAFILALVIFLIWRLDFTFGYESIEFLGLGTFIKDNIMIPIFGSSHYLS